MTERSAEASSSPSGPQGDAQERPGNVPPPPGESPSAESNGRPAASGSTSSGAGSQPASPPPPKQPPPSHPPPARPPSPEAGTPSESAPGTPSGAAGDTGKATSDSDASGQNVDDTAVRPPLATRIQSKLSDAKAEVKAKAAARETQKPSERTSTPTSSASSTAVSAAMARGPRRARLRLTRIDPWSVMKTAFLLSIAFGIVTVVAVAMVWTVLDQAGVWSSVNSTIQEGIGGSETANFDVEDYVGTSRVLGFTMLVAAVDVVLLTAIATLAAFLYNMAAALLGGVEVTLAEDKH